MKTRNRVLIGLSLSLVFGSLSCVPNRQYRVAAPLLHETPPSYCADGGRYTLSFIEFDDMGELWDAQEVDRAVEEIHKHKDQKPLVVLFVHGWKNNASDSSGNVWGFRCELGALAKNYQRDVIGVYVGWRGATTNAEILKNLTFWNRITAAGRIPGAELTDSVLRIMNATKGPKGSEDATLITVGHSFGGLVLERAVTQALVERIDQADAAGTAEKEGVRFPADLVVFVNEAAPALQAKQLLDILSRRSARFTSQDQVAHGPLLLSITSKGDTATHLAFPGGQFLSLAKVSLRDYLQPGTTTPGKDRFGVTDQRAYYLHTTANTDALQSHVIGLVNDPDVKKSLAANQTPFTCATLATPPDPDCNNFKSGTSYAIIPKANALNTTPYWAMQMPVEFVPDHTTIFRPQLDGLLAAFLNQRPDMNLRAVPNVKAPAPTLKLAPR